MVSGHKDEEDGQAIAADHEFFNMNQNSNGKD
jgi:hypothetical protein